MKYNYLLLLLLFAGFSAAADPRDAYQKKVKLKPVADTPNIPFDRVYFHDLIIEQQRLSDKIDGKEDGFLRASQNDAINLQVTDALFRKIKELRYWVEANPAISSRNEKIRYLKYVENVLLYYRVNLKSKELVASELPALISSFELALHAVADSQSILPYVSQLSYGAAKALSQVFSEQPEYRAATALIYVKYAHLHPDKILQSIAPFAQESYADSLIVIACKLNPVQFYSYAQSSKSTVGKLIRRNTDPLVMAVAKLTETDNALYYFPFLDEILSGKTSIDDIKKYVGDGEKTYDSVGYFKLLTKTAGNYYIRTMAGDTPIAYFGANGLLETLKKKAFVHFITPINTLHNENNLAVRMHAIQPLGPIDLYYMIVLSEDEIYTSSYKHSFNRLLTLMGNRPRGDSLLLSVNFDHFKKFIKMAANYNKLDTFLKTMPSSRAEILMRNFVSNLDKTGNLEDAVDVADSYSSIDNKVLQMSMLNYVVRNEQLAVDADNKNGVAIYGLLKTIFESFNDASTDISSEVGIPSIYEVSNKYLQDEKGRIIQQVFWYGDEDGKLFYPQFKNSFNPRDWKVTEKKEWLEAISNKGNVYVFANRPLNNDLNLDDSAQYHLADYLEEQGMRPVVSVHRGHSYWLPRTLDRMAGDAKIVVLGSCGGYQNLNKILENSPDANIISTKEIGAGDINRPILNYLNDAFISGTTLSWRAMWQTLGRNFSADPNKSVRDSWENYIPPYKNLGAIFLKAYSRKMAG